jgi:hypothetical protein
MTWKATGKYDEINQAPVTAKPFVLLGVLFFCLGHFGAMQYKGWMVIVAAMWDCIICAVSVIQVNIGGAMIACFFAYPNLAFYQEMKTGIMTEANYYHNKIHSCCCV